MADQVSSATITAVQGVAGAPCAGLGVFGVDVSGTFVGTFQFEGTIDGANYFAINATPQGLPSAVQSFTATGRYYVPCSGLNAIRVRCSAYTSGSALVVFEGSSAAPRGELDKSSQVVLASASRTTLQTSADIPTGKAKALQVVFDATVVTSGASITLTISGKDPASGKYFTLLAGAAVTSVSTNVYTVGLGAPVTTNVSANAPIPDIIQVSIAVADTKACTYSVGLILTP